MNIFEDFRSLPQSRKEKYINVADRVLQTVVRFEDRVRVPEVEVVEDGKVELTWEETNQGVLQWVDEAILKGLMDLKKNQGEIEPLTMLVAAMDEVAMQDSTPAKALTLIRLIGSYHVVQRYREGNEQTFKSELIKRGLIPRKK